MKVALNLERRLSFIKGNVFLGSLFGFCVVYEVENARQAGDNGFKGRRGRIRPLRKRQLGLIFQRQKDFLHVMFSLR